LSRRSLSDLLQVDIQGTRHVIAAFRNFFLQIRRAREANRLLREAYALHAQERFSDAAEKLREVLATAVPPSDNVFLGGGQMGTRLRAVTLTSIVAAKLGDKATAMEAIDEGVKLFGSIKARMPQGRAFQELNQWEAWAKAYSASVWGE
jgi:hypothetical protein